MTNTNNSKPVHLGRNVKRMREILKIKQEVLADQLGAEWNQKKISMLESKEDIEPALLEELAKAMAVSVDAIKEYSEESVINNVQNNYEGSSNIDQNNNSHCTMSALDKKYIEAIEENQKLYGELLKEKDEKIALLQKMVEMLEKK